MVLNISLGSTSAQQAGFDFSTSASPTRNSSPSPKRFSPTKKLFRSSRSSTITPSPQYATAVREPEAIFSADLNTSPAFDLMPLEQAQKSPVAAADSSSPRGAAAAEASLADPSQSVSPSTASGTEDHLPDISLDTSAPGEPLSIPLQSNNPFLKEIQLDQNAAEGRPLSIHLRDSHTTEHSQSLDPSMQCPYVFPLDGC